jgi:hypothetical protein
LQLFTDKIEHEIKIENEQNEKLLNMQGDSKREQQLSKFNETVNPVILSKQSSIGLG